MQAVFGNAPLLSSLLSAIRQKRVAGCYVITGVNGTGKRTIARYVAAALMCSNPNPDASPCLFCQNCRSVLQHGHVDVIELSPEEEGKSIPVSAVRDMLQGTHMLPTQSDWRVFIIHHAEKMKKEAQNALLKSIEEPRPQTVFFLLTEDLTKLLPTVRSRAVKLRTEPLSDEIISQELKKETDDLEKIENAVLLSAGSLGKAKAILNDTVLADARKTVLHYFSLLMDGAGFIKLCQALPPGALSRQDLTRLLPMFKLALRDLICNRYQKSKPEFFADAVFVKDLASILSPTAAMELFDLIENLERAAEQNVNLFSALTSFHLTAQKLTRS